MSTLSLPKRDTVLVRAIQFLLLLLTVLILYIGTKITVAFVTGITIMALPLAVTLVINWTFAISMVILVGTLINITLSTLFTIS